MAKTPPASEPMRVKCGNTFAFRGKICGIPRKELSQCEESHKAQNYRIALEDGSGDLLNLGLKAPKVFNDRKSIVDSLLRLLAQIMKAAGQEDRC